MQSLSSERKDSPAFPFATDFSGNYLGIDFDLPPVGIFGQIFNFGRDQNTRDVLATSMATFLSRVADDMAEGEFEVRTGERGSYPHRKAPIVRAYGDVLLG